MANQYGTNPVVLDTFSAAIDVGNSLYGLTAVPFFIESITWETPTDASHTAIVTDGGGHVIFNERCVVVNQSILRPLEGVHFQGLKVALGAVGSGKLSILLASA